MKRDLADDGKHNKEMRQPFMECNVSRFTKLVEELESVAQKRDELVVLNEQLNELMLQKNLYIRYLQANNIILQGQYDIASCPYRGHIYYKVAGMMTEYQNSIQALKDQYEAKPQLNIVNELEKMGHQVTVLAKQVKDEMVFLTAEPKKKN